MTWRNRYEYSFEKHRIYCAFCDCILWDIPRYTVDYGNVSQKEIEEIWKQAKRDMQ